MPPPRGHPNPIEGPGDYTTTSIVHDDTYAAIDPTKADLSGRSVLIVGASKGIGKAMALSFAKAGASSIAIAARSDLTAITGEVASAAQDAGRQAPKVIAVKMDVTDVSSVEAAAGEIGGQFGNSLDICIINAGILKGMAKIADSDPVLWWQNVTTNFYGPYLVSRSFIPLLQKSTLKTLITVSSVGSVSLTPGGSGYQISKTAATRLMQFVDAEYASADGIIAYSIHPGNILTDIVGDVEHMDPTFKSIFTETPQLSADSLVFLSKERREWLGGRYVNVTWDLPELMGMQKQIVDGDLLRTRLAVP